MPSVALRQPRPPRFDSHAHRGPCQTRVLSTSTGAFCLCSCSDGQLGRRRGLRRSRADTSRTLARASFSSHAVRSTHLCLTRSRQPCFRALAARRATLASRRAYASARCTCARRNHIGRDLRTLVERACARRDNALDVSVLDATTRSVRSLARRARRATTLQHTTTRRLRNALRRRGAQRLRGARA